MGSDAKRLPRNLALIMVTAYSLALVGVIVSGISQLDSNSNRTLAFAGLTIGVVGFVGASSIWLGWAWRSGALRGTSPEEDERAAAGYYQDPNR
jgi:hypothetical protein